MTRICFTAFLLLALAVPAFADVTIKQSTATKGMGPDRTAKGATYIKGSRMRTDLEAGDRIQSTIFDLDARKAYFFDSNKKEADVWDMGAFAAQMGQSVDAASIKTSVKPNGQTKPFGTLKADGYDLEVNVPAAVGGGKGPTITVTLAGPVWIVRDVPGSADYANFYKMASEKGFIFSDPRAAKGQPGQAKATAEMYKQFAEIGGIAYETTMRVKVGMAGADAGPMAGIFAKMGSIEVQMLVEGVETTPLADDLFAPPAGYKLNTRQ